MQENEMSKGLRVQVERGWVGRYAVLDEVASGQGRPL